MGARLDEYKADEIIMKENEQHPRMYIVLEGKVVLYKNYGEDSEIVYGICSKGKTFGEMNVLSDEPSMYTAVSYDNTRLAWFEKSNLKSYFHSYPDSAMELMMSMYRNTVLLKKNLDMALDEIENLCTNEFENILKIFSENPEASDIEMKDFIARSRFKDIAEKYRDRKFIHNDVEPETD